MERQSSVSHFYGYHWKWDLVAIDSLIVSAHVPESYSSRLVCRSVDLYVDLSVDLSTSDLSDRLVFKP